MLVHVGYSVTLILSIGSVIIIMSLNPVRSGHTNIHVPACMCLHACGLCTIVIVNQLSTMIFVYNVYISQYAIGEKFCSVHV